MLNLIKFLKCNKIKGRILIIKECVNNLNAYEYEKYLKVEKTQISDEIVYPENVRVIEEKNIKINVNLILK
jgi:hypothetical protein